MKWVLYVLPVLVFAALAGFLFFALREEGKRPPDMLASALIGRKVPNIEMPALDVATQGFGPRELSAGHVAVVNVFASWCVPCREEAPELAELARAKDVRLYGLVQKDTPAKVRGYLDETGNPYSRIALDADGRASIEWGVYGVPETFIIDGRGYVRERVVGPLTEQSLANDVLPAIRAARDGT